MSLSYQHPSRPGRGGATPPPTPPNRRRPFWRRWWAIAIAAVAVLIAIGAIAGDPPQSGNTSAAARGTPTGSGSATPAREATIDPKPAARAQAKTQARRGEYAAAIATYRRAGLNEDAARVRRSGARTLYRSAKRALDRGRYTSARRLATASRRLRKTTASATVLRTATTQITRAEAAARERRRLALIARDQRTCTSAEKRTVRDGAGPPAGCTTYAAELARKRAAEEAERQQEQSTANCDPNYEGACLKPDSSDYDCAGGSGDGPDYTGPVQSVGSDPYDLDRDGDGYACEG